MASKTAWNEMPETQDPLNFHKLVQVFVPTVNSKFTPVPAFAETRFASLNLHQCTHLQADGPVRVSKLLRSRPTRA